MSTKARKTDLHQVPDPGAGEGVPFQPLSHQKTPYWDCPCAVFDREADQDLVPEPEDEAQEGVEGSKGDQRTGEEKTRWW